ncbi:MAG: sigma-70 family RNA polymerase sigma factor [Bacteroidetes bacterium]|nr:sigma-70 family RNA polymerase sigma factor [Bacteroidota bacterium]
MSTIKAKYEEDQILLEKVKASDDQALKAVYDQVLPSVIYWVSENQGSEADARDLFQEAMIALYRKLQAGPFELSCRLKSYLRIICRNLWLTRLRDGKKYQASPLSDVEEYELQADMEAQIGQSEEEQLFFRHFDKLGENCRQILQWFFDKVAMSEIARRLESSESYVKKRKFICKERLVKSIQNDPLFNELKSD